MVRQLPGARRSMDPIFSVAAIGKRADELAGDVSSECFGPGSFWEHFLKAGGLICNLNFDAGSTFIHYVEKCMDVPYRYDKLFLGTFRKGDVTSQGAVVFFCQKDLSDPGTAAAFELFDDLARKAGIVRTAKIGRGAVVSVTAADTYQLIAETLPQLPYFLTVAGAPGKGLADGGGLSVRLDRYGKLTAD